MTHCQMGVRDPQGEERSEGLTPRKNMQLIPIYAIKWFMTYHVAHRSAIPPFTKLLRSFYWTQRIIKQFSTVFCESAYYYCRNCPCYTTLHTWRPGFSCHWRQAVELTARRHHHCNICVDFSAQTENIFISSITWHCRLVTTVLSFFNFFYYFFGFYFFSSCF